MNSTTTKTNGHAKLDVRPAKKTEARQSEEIYDIEVRQVAVSLTGTSALIQNRFHGADDMEALRGLDAEARKGLERAPKPPVIPEERYALARIVNAAGEDCVEAAKIKAALVTAASKYKEIGVPATVVRGAVYVMGDMIPIAHRGVKMWPELKPYVTHVPKCGLPRMRRDITRVGKFGSKQPDLRYRPEFQDWSIELLIEYEPSLVTLAGLHQLIRRAGRSVGLYEWRPEKSPAGIFGRFDLTEIVKARRS